LELEKKPRERTLFLTFGMGSARHDRLGPHLSFVWSVEEEEDAGTERKAKMTLHVILMWCGQWVE
jgi:hypothetical protein